MSDIVNVLGRHTHQKYVFLFDNCRHGHHRPPRGDRKCDARTNFMAFFVQKMLLIVMGHYTNAHHLVLWHLICHLIANLWVFAGRHRVNLGR